MGEPMGTRPTGRAATAGTIIAALTMVWPGRVDAAPASFRIDPEHVTVAFLVTHIGFARVLGTFGDVEGSFVFDEDTGELADLSVEVGAASVDTRHEARDDHVRGTDFLDVSRFPTIAFAASSARRTGEQTFEIDGEVEILGVIRPLTLHATLNRSGDYPIGRGVYAIGVSATARLARGDFGMRYALDNGWVGDEVEILIELEARRE